jgi:hypothetical protein
LLPTRGRHDGPGAGDPDVSTFFTVPQREADPAGTISGVPKLRSGVVAALAVIAAALVPTAAHAER